LNFGFGTVSTGFGATVFEVTGNDDFKGKNLSFGLVENLDWFVEDFAVDSLRFWMDGENLKKFDEFCKFLLIFVIFLDFFCLNYKKHLILTCLASCRYFFLLFPL